MLSILLCLSALEITAQPPIPDGRPLAVPPDWRDGPRGGEAAQRIERAPLNCMCRMDEVFAGRICLGGPIFTDYCVPMRRRGSVRRPIGVCPFRHRCSPERTDADDRPRTRCAPLLEDDEDAIVMDRWLRGGSIGRPPIDDEDDLLDPVHEPARRGHPGSYALLPGATCTASA